VALLALADRFLARWCAAELGPLSRGFALAVFASLAIHADVVPSPTGRAELLAAIFSLASVMLAVRERLEPGAIVLSALTLAAALFCKESSTPMVVLVPFLAWRAGPPTDPERRRALVALATLSVLAAAAVWVFRDAVMPFLPAGEERVFDNPLISSPPLHRLAGAMALVAFRLRTFVVGTPLLPDYSFSGSPVAETAAADVAVGVLFCAGCTALFASAWRRAPRLADALAAFGASYVSMSNLLVNVPGIAHRHFFFPSLWLIVAAALLIERAVHEQPARTAFVAATGVFVLAQAWWARSYAQTWRDDVTLLSAATRIAPEVDRSQRNLASALSESGRHDEAAFHLVLAEAINAHYPSPIARDSIPAAWDAEGLPASLAHVQMGLGARATCAAAAAAATHLRSWEDVQAAVELDAWSRGVCAPTSGSEPRSPR
jgi:hypothetical protein